MAHGYAFSYFQKLLLLKEEYQNEILDTYEKLNKINPECIDHIAMMTYSNRLGQKESLLLLKLALLQSINGANVNIDKIFNGLTIKEKSNYEKLFENYQKVTANLPKKDIEEHRAELHEEIRNVQENNIVNQKNIEQEPEESKYIIARNSGEKIINTTLMPKFGWLLNVYADSFKDYCEIVQGTMKYLKDMLITVFLTMPEEFEKNIKNSKSALAFSIFVNENFSFSKLDDKIIQLFDNKEIEIPKNNLRISSRIGAEYLQFTGKMYSDFSGNIKQDKSFIYKKYDSVEEYLKLFENIGNAKNIVRYYTEIMTGIPENVSEQFYKTIVFKTEDYYKIQKIVKKYDEYNLDFIIDTNEPFCQNIK